jgi:hypothetical protein
MRINGQQVNDTYFRQIELPRADGRSLCLKISPLSLSFQSQLRRHGIVKPLPPTRVARDSGGQPIRDRQGLAVLTADEHDHDYLEQQELYHQRVAVLVLAESLRADPAVEFESQPPQLSDQQSSGDWSDYADRLYGELEEAGWSAGDLIWVCHEVSKLSNLLTEHLQETERNFSSGAPAPLP